MQSTQSTAQEVRIGRYEVLRKIATGGMADLFLAKQVGMEGFEKVVAIKKILPHLAHEEEFINMFRDEARLVAKLSHPNIVQIYDLGKAKNTYFIAMEYIPGRNLASIAKRAHILSEPLPPAYVARCLAQACEGLYYAHNRKDVDGRPLHVVHRDVSPQNIIVSFSGTVKLVDFGIAKAAKKIAHTRPGVLKGKYAYMSPEQVRGDPIDARSDVFAAGIVLYELLCGQRPFEKKNSLESLKAIVQEEPRPAEEVNANLPSALADIIARALQKDPGERFQDAQKLQLSLEDFVTSSGERVNNITISRWVTDLFEEELSRERGGTVVFQGVGEIILPDVPADPASRGEEHIPSEPLPLRRGRGGGTVEPSAADPRAPALFDAEPVTSDIVESFDDDATLLAFEPADAKAPPATGPERTDSLGDETIERSSSGASSEGWDEATLGFPDGTSKGSLAPPVDAEDEEARPFPFPEEDALSSPRPGPQTGDFPFARAARWEDETAAHTPEDPLPPLRTRHDISPDGERGSGPPLVDVVDASEMMDDLQDSTISQEAFDAMNGQIDATLSELDADALRRAAMEDVSAPFSVGDHDLETLDAQKDGTFEPGEELDDDATVAGGLAMARALEASRSEEERRDDETEHLDAAVVELPEDAAGAEGSNSIRRSSREPPEEPPDLASTRSLVSSSSPPSFTPARDAYHASLLRGASARADLSRNPGNRTERPAPAPGGAGLSATPLSLSGLLDSPRVHRGPGAVPLSEGGRNHPGGRAPWALEANSGPFWGDAVAAAMPGRSPRPPLGPALAETARIQGRGNFLATSLAVVLVGLLACVTYLAVPYVLGPPTPLRIETTPPGARVFIDGTLQRGRTPLGLRGLEANRPYMIRLELTGYDVVEQDFKLPKDRRIIWRIPLRAQAR